MKYKYLVANRQWPILKEQLHDIYYVCYLLTIKCAFFLVLYDKRFKNTLLKLYTQLMHFQDSILKAYAQIV